jgi:hypothetical protein
LREKSGRIPEGRRTAPSRITEYAMRIFRFPLSCFPFFTFRFISCAHLTTFFKTEKTYGNVFEGTVCRRGISNSKKTVFGSKMTRKWATQVLFEREQPPKTPMFTGKNTIMKNFFTLSQLRHFFSQRGNFELRNGFAIRKRHLIIGKKSGWMYSGSAAGTRFDQTF